MNHVLSIRVRGSTLVEVLIALAILGFCSAFVVLIYINIQKSNLTFFKLKALEISERFMKETLEKRDFTEHAFHAEEFNVKRFTRRHDVCFDCVDIRIIVFDSEKRKLFELQSVALDER